MAMPRLIVHAPSKATRASRRHVLHLCSGPANLPNGLAWAPFLTPVVAS